MSEYIELLAPSIWETVYMVLSSTVISLLLGFPLGVLLVITDKDGIWKQTLVNKVLGAIINVTRSLPFIILMIAVFPLSKLILGKTIGTTAAIVPLSVAAAPFVARVIEGALKEVDRGVIEASQAMGATNLQIIFKVYLPESLPSLILGITLTIINLLGYSAMAGAIGGGGLGDLAIRYGYYKSRNDIMLITIIVLVVLVQGVQTSGNIISKKILRR